METSANTMPMTIWESASRPLFVRSVWLETANGGRTHRRHFILDYEPKERERLRSISSAISPSRKRRSSLRQTNSYDDYDYNNGDEYMEDCVLLGTTKLTLQDQQQSVYASRNSIKKIRCSRLRHNWLHGSRKSIGCFNSYIHTTNRELYSRRSSLQDIQSTLSNTYVNPEERLAERVLNWLDLAGKTEILKTEENISLNNDTPTMGKESIQHLKSNKIRSENMGSKRTVKRVSTAHPNAIQRGPTMLRRTSTTSKSQTMPKPTPPPPLPQPPTNGACQRGRPDSVKPITIIFNREGVPIRFNRPARNIDLCALSSSASTTRRLAGQLASARLYSGNSLPGNSFACESLTGRDDGGHKLTTHPPQSSRSLQDMKKQLHIFMPSLPKKGLQYGNSYPSTEADTPSALSQAFSELCQI